MRESLGLSRQTPPPLVALRGPPSQVAMHPRAAVKLANTATIGLLGDLTRQRIGRKDAGSVVRCVAAMDKLTKANESDEVCYIAKPFCFFGAAYRIHWNGIFLSFIVLLRCC